MDEFFKLLNELSQATVWAELLVLTAGVAVAYAATSALGRGQPSESVWFGERVIDGVLMPLMLSLLIYAATYGLAPYHLATWLKLVWPVCLSLAIIRLVVRVLSASFTKSPLIVLVERMVAWVVWLFAVLWITGLLPAFLAELEGIQLPIGKSHMSLRTLVEGIISSGVVLTFTLWMSATLERRIMKQSMLDMSSRKVASNVLRAVLLLLGLITALSAVGVDLTALSVLGGALGVGLGLGLQKLAANYVSGFVILLERSLRIGDMVKVDGFEGVVKDITTRYTLIRSLDGRESIVPNELIMTQRVENQSLQDRQVLVSLHVSVAYASDVGQVQSILCNAALACDRVLKDPPPAAFLHNFGADGLDFTLAVWIDDPTQGTLGPRSEINRHILRGLRTAGIEIPYPQRVVEVRSAQGLPRENP